MLDSKSLRKKYLEFFRDRGHTIIPSASLIPENDPTVLFTTAGMQPLVPYLLGQKHPGGKRLTDVQKCVRTGDIDEVGDDTHCTFFEMLGNWSLGDYFKRESIAWSYEFLTKVLGISPDKLAVTVFAGDEDCPRDTEAAARWQEMGIPADRIFYLPKENNWWIAGTTGPCGEDTEIFYIDETKPGNSPADDGGRYVEIWNNVFMHYYKHPDGTYTELAQKNIDTGMGLERTLMTLNGYRSVYDTDVLSPVAELLRQKISDTGAEAERAVRIIADHTRTATFILGDPRGVAPSNVDRGYILRRLIRRAVRYARQLGLPAEVLTECAQKYIEIYGDFYTELQDNSAKILEELQLETEKFDKTLHQGLKEFEKLLGYIKDNRISGKAAFKLYDTYGFPPEMTVELSREHGVTVDMEGFQRAFNEHQQKSKAGSEQKFKGGLSDSGEETTRLHTATHLLMEALRRVLSDPTIMQKGSNITPERLRLDFNFPRPLTAEEIAKVEDKVNEAIAAAVPVTCEEMTPDAAHAAGAVGVFGDRYGDIVKVYTMGNYSKEICGGPHAANTSELGHFKIVKEQSSSAGIRRIKAVLESK